MPILGNDGTIPVGAAGFTTTTTGAVLLPKSTMKHRAWLINVSLIANAQSSPAVSCVTYLNLSDTGGDAIMRMPNLCGTIAGDAQADQGTDGLDWIGRVLLGNIRNKLSVILNNDSASSVAITWGYTVEVED